MTFRLTLILCLLCSLLEAQNPIIFQSRNDRALAYSYNNVSGSSANTVKRMLQDLNPNNLNRSRFELHYTEVIKAVKRSSQELQVFIELENIYIDNLPPYKSMPMEQAFLPQELRFDVLIQSNGQLLNRRNIPNKPILPEGLVEPIEIIYNDSLSRQNYEMLLDNVEFVFNNACRQKVQQRIDWINGYEQASVDLRNMTAQLQSLNLQNPNPDAIPSFVGRVDALSEQYQLIHQAAFWEGLQLLNNQTPDPFGIAQAEQNYVQTFGVASARVTELMNTIHLAYFDQGQVLLQQNNPQAAANSFQKALNYQPQFSPAQIALGDVLLRQGRIDEATEQLRQSFLTNELDEQSRQRASALLLDCRDAYLQQARNLEQEGRFGEALARVDVARSICAQTPHFNCDDNLVVSQRQSIYRSDFNARREQVQQLFQNNQLDKALAECEELMAFQKAEQIRVNFDTPLLHKRILNALLDRHLTAADRDFQRGRYNEGLAAVQQGADLQRRYLDVLSKTRIETAYQKGYTGLLQQKQEAAQQAEQKARREADNRYYERAIQASLQAIEQYKEARQLIEEQPQYLRPLKALETAYFEAQNKHYQWLYEWTEHSLQQKQLGLAQEVLGKLQSWAKRSAVKARHPNEPAVLEEKVEYQVYLDLANRADALQKSGQQAQAIELYRQAQNLDFKHNFTQAGKGRDISSKINSAAEQEILQAAQPLLRSTDNEAIRRRAAELRSRAAANGVSRAPSVQQVFTQLDERICSNARERLYPAAEQEALRLARTDAYIEAETALQTAKELAREYANCQLDRSRLLEVASEIRSCADFQRKLQEVEDLERNRRFKEALEGWEELGQFYAKAEVSENLPEPIGIDLKAYLLKMNNARYIYIGALHFNESRKAPADAFDVLKHAHQRGWDARQARQLQEELGLWAAEQIYDPNRKWKDAVVDYIGTMKREFKFFRKAFKLRWKSF